MKYFNLQFKCVIAFLLFFLNVVLLSSQTNEIQFTEIWAYLSDGEERFFNSEYPISDIGYFGAGINSFGKLVGVPNRTKITNFNGKVHLVIAEVSNRALNHFSINPLLPLRNELINDIVKASEPFDGIQIDFELVSAVDKDNFYSFLAQIKSLIGDKIFSVAIPARTKYVQDAYEYERIAAIADRIIIMAYDEHWSGSTPGSIASIDWCSRVADYAIKQIPAIKLVMGMPFYGRAWADVNPAKAYKHSTLSSLITEKQIELIKRENQIPFFTYQQLVTVNVYFEDSASVLYRSQMYQAKGVKNISFWRLGQEDSRIWSGLKVTNKKNTVGR